MKKSNVISVLSAIVVLGLIFFYEYYEDQKLEKNALYTIGVVKGYENLSRGGVALVYEFYYDSTLYTGERPIDFSKNKRNQLIGRRFFVKFNPENPKLSSIDFDKIVRDSLLEPPPDGWKDLSKVK